MKIKMQKHTAANPAQYRKLNSKLAEPLLGSKLAAPELNLDVHDAPPRPLKYYYAINGHTVNSRRRPVSPGPESRYLGSLDNINISSECECDTHVPQRLSPGVKYKWTSDDSSLYDGTLKPITQRRNLQMFQPSWQAENRDADDDRSRSTSPHWKSFSEAAFGVSGVNATYHGHVPNDRSYTPRHRNYSYDSIISREDKLLKNSVGSPTNTHVNRLARSGSAASLAVVMASTFPNGGDANFDLDGTAAKINEVCKSLNAENGYPEVNLRKSRSMNAAINVIHSPEIKPTRPLFLSPPSRTLKIRTTPEKRGPQPMKALRPSASYSQIKELQEKLKDATEISYNDLLMCPKNRLPRHIDKLQLQKYLPDEEFNEVFKISKEQFNDLPAWRQISLKKEALLF